MRTNRTVSVYLNGAAVNGLDSLSCLVMPARPEIVAMQGIPAGKQFEIFFPEVYASIREGHEIVNDADSTERYRVIGTSHFDTPHGAHSEILAEARWGNA